MIQWQDLLQNRAFWALVVTIIATITNMFGIDFNHDGLVNSLLAISGGVIAIWAIVKNHKRVKSVAGAPVNTGDPDHPTNRTPGAPDHE